MAEEMIAAGEGARLADVLMAMHEHLTRTHELIEHGMPHRARRRVDIRQSAAAALSVQLRTVQSAIVLVQTILYSVPAAAVITIGDRQIPVPAGANSLTQLGILVMPGDTVSVALSGVSPAAGAMHLEMTGEQIGPDEQLEVVR